MICTFSCLERKAEVKRNYWLLGADERTGLRIRLLVACQSEKVGCLKGHISIEEAAEEVKKASRHYAKRQLTWFKRNKSIHWLTRTEDTSAEEILNRARQLIQETDK